jgi:hypothetical protein
LIVKVPEASRKSNIGDIKMNLLNMTLAIQNYKIHNMSPFQDIDSNLLNNYLATIDLDEKDRD